MGDRTWGSVLKVGTDNALLTKWIKFSAITACLRETQSAEGSGKEEPQGGAAVRVQGGGAKLLALLRGNELGG